VCAKHRKQDEVAGFVKLGIVDDNRGRASPLGILSTPTPQWTGHPPRASNDLVEKYLGPKNPEIPRI
jgi:hypothetical protein